MRASASRAGLAVRSGAAHGVRRSLPEETPVALVFDGATQAVMMATPDDLADFAHGFALSEGIVESLDQIAEFEIVPHADGIEARFWLSADRSGALKARRRAMLGPVGCGLCGIDSLAQALRPLPRLAPGTLLLSHGDIAGAGDALRAHQPLHDLTHAVHAAGFLRPGAGLVLAREDVGRHNALDKLIGAMALAGIDASAGAIVLTSRVSVEMVQKAVMARCAVLVAVSAPTATALRVAEAAGLTVAAFARGADFDVYSHPGRISTGGPHVA